MTINMDASVVIIIPSRKVDELLSLCLKKTRLIYKNIPIIAVLDDISEANAILHYGNLTVLHQDGTIAKKRNAAADISQTKYLAFLDSDAYPKENWLEELIKFLESSQQYAAAVPMQINAEDDSFLQQCIRNLKRSPLTCHRDIIAQNNPKAKDTDVKLAVTTGIVINRQYFFQVSKLDESFVIQEDWDISKKFLSNRFKLRFIRNSVICHRERTFLFFVKRLYCCFNAIYDTFLKTKSGFLFVTFFAPLFLFSTTVTLALFGFYKPVAAILLIVFLLTTIESIRLSKNFLGFFVTFFMFISFYIVCIFSELCALLRIDPKIQKIYTHK